MGDELWAGDLEGADCVSLMLSKNCCTKPRADAGGYSLSLVVAYWPCSSNPTAVERRRSGVVCQRRRCRSRSGMFKTKRAVGLGVGAPQRPCAKVTRRKQGRESRTELWAVAMQSPNRSFIRLLRHGGMLQDSMATSKGQMDQGLQGEQSKLPTQALAELRRQGARAVPVYGVLEGIACRKSGCHGLWTRSHTEGPQAAR